MKPILVVIVCVDYSDFLALTIPATKAAFGEAGRISVLTEPSDVATVRLCEKNRLVCVPSRRLRNGTFSKSDALQEYILSQQNHWLLFLDADIMLPKEASILNQMELDDNFLYGCRRRLIESNSDLRDYLAGRKTECDFPYSADLVPCDMVSHGWRNPVGLPGFFQLWFNDGSRKVPHSDNASEFDIEFAVQWPDVCRRRVPFDVLHLGPIAANWNGRITERWSA